MPGMLAGSVRERRKFFNRAFISGWSDYNATNEAADQIVETPDRFLLSQEELFEAEGGWATFGLTMSLAGLGATAVLMMRPGMAAHFGRGQLKMFEWCQVGGAALAGGFLGNQGGVMFLGDSAKYNSHWMAYSFIKCQNRYLQRNSNVLTDEPTY